MTTRPRRARLLAALLLGAVLLAGASLFTGSGGWSPAALRADLADAQAALLYGQIRAPRTLGALLVGALLGLAGAVAQAQ